MREILFRGFHPCEDGDKTVCVEGKAVKGRWVEGIPINKNRYIIVSCFDIKELTDEDCMRLKGVIHKVLPSTVNQYTGLTDKNGVRIFEGDICKDGMGWVFEVQWDNENARFLGRHDKARGDTYICYVGRIPAVEIIGNIHEKTDGESNE